MTDDQLLAAPVIVVGSPRSGTTALGEMLEIHSTLHGLVEPRLTWRYGNDGKSDVFRAEHATPAIVAHIRRTFAGHVRAAGRSRLLEKTPSNALRVEFVRRVFPDAKIIHIIRNGIDSSLSIRSFWENAAHGIKIVRKGAFTQRWKEMRLSQVPHYALEAMRRVAPRPLTGAIGQNMWGPRLPGMRGMLRDLQLLEVCTLQWRTCVEAARHSGAKMSSDKLFRIQTGRSNPRKVRRTAGLRRSRSRNRDHRELRSQLPARSGSRPAQRRRAGGYRYDPSMDHADDGVAGIFSVEG